jgi:hypothetical protein
MNAANNLALMQIGPAVADHDSQTMNEPATKQDLYNIGVQIDSNFGKVMSQFVIVDSQFTNLRTDMNAGFDKVYSQFSIVDSQITNLRTDMDAGFSNLRTDMDSQFIKFRAEMSEQFSKVYTMFDTKQVELNKTLFKFGSLYFTMMFAVLSIERWWR